MKLFPRLSLLQKRILTLEYITCPLKILYRLSRRRKRKQLKNCATSFQVDLITENIGVNPDLRVYFQQYQIVVVGVLLINQQYQVVVVVVLFMNQQYQVVVVGVFLMNQQYQVVVVGVLLMNQQYQVVVVGVFVNEPYLLAWIYLPIVFFKDTFKWNSPKQYLFHTFKI